MSYCQIKKGDGVSKEMMRAKLERLSLLTSEFLEKSFSYDSLVSDWTEMERIKDILRVNLWNGNIDPDDPDWCPDTNEDFATMILYFHRLLTEGFWNNFKEELQFSKAIKGPIVVPQGYEGVEPDSLAMMDAFIKVDIPEGPMTVRFVRNSDSVHFFRGSVDAIPALLHLLQELPLDNLRFCGNTKCGKLIVKTSGRDLKFCSSQCQSVQYQRELREKDPEKHKKYHRGYYHDQKERRAKKLKKIT